MFNYDLLFTELKKKGFKQNVIATNISIDQNTLSKKILNKTTQELTGTQITIICEMLQSPIDRFKGGTEWLVWRAN